jgi:hypothetical protein
MKLKEAARRFWRNIEAFAYALEYDQYTDFRLRVERLERLAADLKEGSELIPSISTMSMATRGRSIRRYWRRAFRLWNI